MGFVISMNVKEQQVGVLQGGLELISSSKCLTRCTVMEKGERIRTFI